MIEECCCTLTIHYMSHNLAGASGVSKQYDTAMTSCWQLLDQPLTSWLDTLGDTKAGQCVSSFGFSQIQSTNTTHSLFSTPMEHDETERILSCLTLSLPGSFSHLLNSHLFSPSANQNSSWTPSITQLMIRAEHPPRRDHFITPPYAHTTHNVFCSWPWPLTSPPITPLCFDPSQTGLCVITDKSTGVSPT